eukprot:COSAG05_NODE_379_length_10567_cov_18.553687_18_plen_147_part_00
MEQRLTAMTGYLHDALLQKPGQGKVKTWRGPELLCREDNDQEQQPAIPEQPTGDDSDDDDGDTLSESGRRAGLGGAGLLAEHGAQDGGEREAIVSAQWLPRDPEAAIALSSNGLKLFHELVRSYDTHSIRIIPHIYYIHRLSVGSA